MVYHAPHPPVRQTELVILHLGFVLSRAIHESVPLGLGRRRSQGRLYAPVPSGAEPQPAEFGREAARGRHHLEQSDRAAEPVERQPGEQRYPHHHGKPCADACRLPTRQLRSESQREEKRLGDLAIKIFEHFLSLFVGTYSAAPYRIDFAEFHPEKLLSFLPHELDFTHLRLMWREWKEKAQHARARASGDTVRAARARQFLRASVPDCVATWCPTTDC